MVSAVIYDAHGRPLPSRDELEGEHFSTDEIDWWSREPALETLSPRRVARMMRDADDGDPEEYLVVAAELERRDLHYHGVLFQRKTAVSNAPVVVKSASDSDHDRELAQAVTDHLLPKLPVFHMQDALGKGISYIEILWDTSAAPWRPRGFKWRRPTRFQLVDGVPHLVSPDRQSSAPLPWAKYIVHEPQLKSGMAIRGGLARLVAFAFALKHFTIRDLARFLEVYGIPARIGRYASSIKDDERRRVLRELARLGTDAVGLLPESVNIELLETQSKGGPEGFLEVAQWWDRQVSKGVIGQTMTSDEGSSLSQSKTHDRVRIDISRHDAKVTGETLNAQLVRAFIDMNFGVQDRYPSIVLEVKDPENLAAWSQATTQFIDRGLKVSQRVIRERLAIADPDPDDEVLEPIVKGPASDDNAGENDGDGDGEGDTGDGERPGA